MLLTALVLSQVPNLILIDIDDAGFDLISQAPTPTLDALGDRGKLFTNFWSASPVCSGSRTSLQSGQYPSRSRNLTGQIIRDGDTWEMPYVNTLASNLTVTTSKVGKWHISNRLYHPLDVGYNEFFGTTNNLGPTSAGLDFYTWWHSNGTNEVLIDDGSYATTYYADAAIDRINQGIAFISLSMHAPHKPWHVPPSSLHTQGVPLNPTDKAIAALQALDTELLRIFRAAVSNNYHIIVVSDNGTATIHGGEKGTLRQGGINVPLWMYPAPNYPEDTMLNMVDLYGHVLTHFGVSIPLGTDSLPFGFRTLNVAEKFASNGPAPYSRYSSTAQYGNHKLIVNNDGSEEFYLLPDETNILSSSGLEYDILSTYLNSIRP
jgi:arylsulfatase B